MYRIVSYLESSSNEPVVPTRTTGVGGAAHVRIRAEALGGAGSAQTRPRVLAAVARCRVV